MSVSLVSSQSSDGESWTSLAVGVANNVVGDNDGDTEVDEEAEEGGRDEAMVVRLFVDVRERWLAAVLKPKILKNLK